MNAQNRTYNYTKEEIDPYEYYTYTFDFVTNDYTIKKGHRLGLVLYGMDVDQTQLPYTVTTITIQKDSIRCTIPLEGN